MVYLALLLLNVNLMLRHNIHFKHRGWNLSNAQISKVCDDTLRYVTRLDYRSLSSREVATYEQYAFEIDT
jgi:hypothetical protein